MRTVLLVGVFLAVYSLIHCNNDDHVNRDGKIEELRRWLAADKNTKIHENLKIYRNHNGYRGLTTNKLLKKNETIAAIHPDR